MTNNENLRLPPDARRLQLLDHAVALAETTGFRCITGGQVARAAGLKSHGLIWHYFGSIGALRNAVMARAVETDNVEVVLQGLVSRHPLALRAPEELKARARYQLSQE